MSPKKIRRKSLSIAKRLGYSVNKKLPLLDPYDHHCRRLGEVTDRLLSLHVVVACSYGFSKKQAAALLRDHGLLESMTPGEATFLDADSDDHQRLQFQWQVESLWALAWCLRVHENLDFAQPCGANFVSLLPNLKHADTNIKAFRDTLSLRSPEEILKCADLAYCLHWSERDAQLHGRPVPGRVQAGVVVERRRSLEWVISNQPWDEVSLDT